MKKPKVSIIVPIYNVEKYLDRCMKSLQNQTLKEIEMIMVDDGSPDLCPRMCDEYAKTDIRIKVIHKQNEGLGFARNSGIDIFSGEYVAFVDSDDYVDLSMYETLYEEAKSSNADVVFCGFKTEIQQGKWKDSNEVSQRKKWTGVAVQDFMLDMVACAPHVSTERKYQMSVWHSIYKREIIVANNLRFPSERNVVSEDLPFQVDFFKLCNKVVYIPQSYYYYCLNRTSLTATFKPEKYDRFKNLYFSLCEKLKGVENASLRVDRFFIGYVRSHLQHLVSADFEEKNREIERICEDPIWQKLGLKFNPSNLPIYPSIVYRLILNKHGYMLYMFYRLILNIKKFKNMRV